MEAKEIATQAGTSDAVEEAKKTKSRGDTSIMRPDGTSRQDQREREQFDNDVDYMRGRPDM